MEVGREGVSRSRVDLLHVRPALLRVRDDDADAAQREAVGLYREGDGLPHLPVIRDGDVRPAALDEEAERLDVRGQPGLVHRTYFDLVLAVVEDEGVGIGRPAPGIILIFDAIQPGTRVTAAGAEGGGGVVTPGADEVSGQIGAQLRGLGIHREGLLGAGRPAGSVRGTQGDGMHAVAQGEAAAAGLPGSSICGDLEAGDA